MLGKEPFRKSASHAYRCRTQRTVDLLHQGSWTECTSPADAAENQASWVNTRQPAQVVQEADSLQFLRVGRQLSRPSSMCRTRDDSNDPTPWWVKHIAFEGSDMKRSPRRRRASRPTACRCSVPRTTISASHLLHGSGRPPLEITVRTKSRHLAAACRSSAEGARQVERAQERNTATSPPRGRPRSPPCRPTAPSFLPRQAVKRARLRAAPGFDAGMGQSYPAKRFASC